MMNPDLKIKLMETGKRELIEGNTWGDTYWGVCEGMGQNTLGKILMVVRRFFLVNERQDSISGNPESHQG